MGRTNDGRLALHGTDLFGEPVMPESRGKLADDFVCPPFTVLNAREGWWQNRKRGWMGLGIQSELGRGRESDRGSNEERGGTEAGLTYGAIPDYAGEKKGKARKANTGGTSIFDPVLCELMYRWFTPTGATVLDPFAGGSVRGIVSAVLGRPYVGIELRAEQVDANRAQAGDILVPEFDATAEWIAGDSRVIDMLCPDLEADFLFTCPPYGSLEVYSDDPADISAMDEHDFAAAYASIINESCKKLRNNRFAAIVVGDYRGSDGFYENFVSHTIDAFIHAGLELYNELILVTAVGSLAVRTIHQFNNSRKAGKTHQNVLVFAKGDPIKATEWCGPVIPVAAEIDENFI